MSSLRKGGTTRNTACLIAAGRGGRLLVGQTALEVQGVTAPQDRAAGAACLQNKGVRAFKQIEISKFFHELDSDE